MNIETKPLEKLEDCISTIKEKGVLLDDEDLINSAKELKQVREEIEEFIKVCLVKIGEVRDSVINQNSNTLLEEADEQVDIYKTR